jgi:hypothetical protein
MIINSISAFKRQAPFSYSRPIIDSVAPREWAKTAIEYWSWILVGVLRSTTPGIDMGVGKKENKPLSKSRV